MFELFTDHAVLQRDVDHPIWGWAEPNRRITVTLDDELMRVRTDVDGKWTATLPATAAGGPHVIKLGDGRSEIALEDVYFGDVYLLSGQSNMEWRLSQSDPDSSRARAIADPLIRQVLVAKTAAEQPGEHLTLDEDWQPGTAEEIAGFSGVGAYFAHYLRRAGIAVPLGLVHSSWGGSRIEPWLSAEVLGVAGQDAKDESTTMAERVEAKVKAFYRSEFGEAEPPITDEGEALGYLEDKVDLSEWAKTELPGPWEAAGYENVDGIFYYRRTFELTEAQAAEDATLYLGTVDDGDWTYINGTLVGTTPNAYSEEREYNVPASVLRAGENSLAFRVFDGTGGGGFMSGPEAMYLATGDGEVPLSGAYYYRIGEFISGQGQPNQVPTLLYNAMIAPMQAWPLTGILWYQGESNAGPGDAEAYADHMRMLITSWRDRFGRKELPFYWAQLANFQAPSTSPNDPGWAILRASQTAALDLPLTGQAVITDIGEAEDIHPRNKWEVGRRLSLHALKDVYGQQVAASSPVAQSVSFNGPMAIVKFSAIGSGLEIKVKEEERYEVVKSLAVRDEAENWHWAIGILHPDGNSVLVLNPAGGDISAVRYAWSNNPDDANLFSKDGLPVTPFEFVAE